MKKLLVEVNYLRKIQYSFTVYDRVLTDEEVNALFG